jgi:hypothetical protein
LVAAALLIVTFLLVAGCNAAAPGTTTGPSPPPVGTEQAPTVGPNWFPAKDTNFHQLTDAEKDKTIEIALSSPEASAWLQGRTDYRLGPLEWYAIIWNNSEAGTWWALDYDVVQKGVPGFVSKATKFYPGVTIAVGEGTIIQMQVAIDLETEKVVLVDGPYPSLGSPDRFKSISPP